MLTQLRQAKRRDREIAGSESCRARSGIWLRSGSVRGRALARVRGSGLCTCYHCVRVARTPRPIKEA